MAAAIVIGAAIAVGGAFGLHRLDRTPKKTAHALAALEQRVAALEHRPAPQQVDVSGLKNQVSGLASDTHATAAALAGLRQKVLQLETAQKNAAQTAAAGRSAPNTPSAAPVDLAPLTARVSKLADALAALDSKLAALDSQVGGLDGKISTLDSKTSRLAGKVGNLEGKMASARAAQAAGTRAAQGAADRADANAVAIIAANLHRDVQAGAPFGNDLSALASHGFDKQKLGALQPVAQSGVATPAALAKEFSAAVPQIMASEPTPKANDFLGRLAQDASRLVRIHRIGDTAGHDLNAQVARIEAALANGNVESALHEWDALPPTAKAKSQSFATAARQRVAANTAATTIETDALNALAKTKS